MKLMKASVLLNIVGGADTLRPLIPKAAASDPSVNAPQPMVNDKVFKKADV